jgi:putative FmdB family regulatory protein
MPIYEYECEDCGVFTAQRTIAKRSAYLCPECRRPAKKKMSVPMVIYKGSGFYTKENVLQDAEDPLDTMD